MLHRPTTRLLAILAAALAVLGGGTAIAVAAIGGSGATPPPKPLAQAVHDALTAPAVQGITARIRFTNHLVDTGSLPEGSGATPLLSGASGRLWASADGRLRLELQSDRGDAQITSDGKTVTILDSARNAAYRITLPQHGQHGPDRHGPPSVADIERVLGSISGSADVGSAEPSNVAGRPAYTVRISPRHDGGLTTAAELAWDAATGTPLRAAIYASGDSKPVLELEATDISFGRVSASDLEVPVPSSVKTTNIDLGGRGAVANGPEITGVSAVSAQVPFRLSAPDKLVGLPRGGVRLIDMDGTKGALVTYGAGLGGIAVLQTPASGAKPGDSGLPLPKVSIDGVGGEELATALGTVVHFERDGVAYTIVGSVPPAAAEAAARGL